ncbi:hypothetical protein GCM10023185_07090 [Hymenobacter saemangeumensis]|uniref:Uncharacterized protein n=1 Tax=Hymenobacter saemangeumensis TaxID=1084522 RepID=A0ABP8I2X5_9BACT
MSQTNQPSWTLDELKATYYQPSDTCQTDQLGQWLKVSTEDAGGGDYYMVLESVRWAIDSPEELMALLADFQRRAQGLGIMLAPVPAARPTPDYFQESSAAPRQVNPSCDCGTDGCSLCFGVVREQAVPAAQSTSTEPATIDGTHETLYLCDKCGHDGGLAFDDCTQPGCKGMYLTGRQSMGPHKVHEYGFGMPAGPYPVDAIDIDKVRTVTVKPGDSYDEALQKLATNGHEQAQAETSEPATASDTPENNDTSQAWSEEDDKLLVAKYSVMSNAALAALLDRSERAIQLRAGRLQLKKAATYKPVRRPKSPESPRAGKRKANRVTPVTEPAPAPEKRSFTEFLADKAPEIAGSLDQDTHARITKAVRELGGRLLSKADTTEKAKALGLLSRYESMLHEVPGASDLYTRLAAE